MKNKSQRSTPTESGKRLAAFRKAAGLSQIQLAAMVDIPQRTLSFYETSAESIPSSVIPKLAEALGVTVEDILGISKKTANLIKGNPDGLYVSAISAFEIAVKHKKNKLELPKDPWPWFEEAIYDYNLKVIPISAKIAALSPLVDVPHAAPCDRIIVASAITHDLHVVSPDRLIQKCPDIQVSW